MPSTLSLIAAAALSLSLSASAAQVRINCGGPALPAIGWLADTVKFRSKPSGGFQSPKQVAAPGSWRPAYDTHSHAPYKLAYNIPLLAGKYTISLLFAETYHSAAGKRILSVNLGDRVVAKTLDVFAAAGGAFKAHYVDAGAVTVGGGKVLSIEIKSAGAGGPMLSGIVINGEKPGALLGGGTPPSPTGGCRTAKTVTGAIADNSGFLLNIGGKAIADQGFAADNRNYIPDKFKGESFVANIPGDVGKSRWAAMWASSRWTTLPALTYVIPAPKGNTKFRIGLFVVESYFGKNGARVFDVAINGKVLDAKVDIHKRVGKSKPMYLQFDNIQPVDGKLTISLKRMVENPTLNGIYIEGEGIGTTAIGGFEDGSC